MSQASILSESNLSESDNLHRQTKVDRAAFLTHLLNLRSEATDLQINRIRDRAADRITELAIPSIRDEEWRFTDLSDLLAIGFQAATPSTVSPSDIEPFQLPEVSHRLVFVDGYYVPELSTATELPVGVLVGNLATAIAQNPGLLDRLGQQQGAEDVFTTLNTASFGDAAVIWISRNQVVDAPIHLLFLSSSDGATLSHPRCLVVAETNSSLTLVEEYGFLAEGTYFTNPVTEIWVEANAQVNHTRIERDSVAAFHMGKTSVSQERDSRYTCNAITLGAKLSRHNLEVYQDGEQTQTTLNGLTKIAGQQVADTHSAIAFTKPHGSSRQVHKCIIDDSAHAIFNGKVFVPKPAQLTDAGQLNQNLLLSPKARMDTKPQLEITADNVKCSHGATVSQLEGDEIFYLQSRGIDQKTARQLLIYAFAYETISQIPLPSLRDRLATLGNPLITP